MAKAKGESMPVLGDDEFNHAQFRIAGTDTRGHSERLSVRVMPWYLHQLEAILASRLYPYRSVHEIVRHAIHVHVEWLLKNKREIPSYLGQIDAINELMRRAEMERSFDEVLTRLKEMTGKLLTDGADGEARLLVVGVMRQIEAMPEGYWKGKYKKDMAKSYGHLIENAPVLDMGKEK